MGGVMVSLFALSAIDHGSELLLYQTKDYKIDFCCYSKSASTAMKELVQRLLFQSASTIKFQLSMFVHFKADIIIIS